MQTQLDRIMELTETFKARIRTLPNASRINEHSLFEVASTCAMVSAMTTFLGEDLSEYDEVNAVGAITHILPQLEQMARKLPLAMPPPDVRRVVREARDALENKRTHS